MLTLQDIHDLIDTGSYTWEYLGDAWERGYISIFYADPECPDSAFVMYEGKGSRKDTIYYLYPSTKSAQYRLRRYFAVYDANTGETIPYKRLCHAVLKMRANESLARFNERGCR